MGGGLLNAMRWKKRGGKIPLPLRGVYLRFEDLNVSAVVPRDSVWVFLPLTLSLSSVVPAAPAPTPCPPTFASSVIYFFIPEPDKVS